MLLRPWQPQRQNSLETLGAGVARGFPDQTEHGDHLGGVARGDVFCAVRWAFVALDH